MQSRAENTDETKNIAHKNSIIYQVRRTKRIAHPQFRRL